MTYTQAYRNVESVFPNLVAIVNYDPDRPGRWEVVLRRGIKDGLVFSIIQCASHLVRSSAVDDLQPFEMYKSLEVCASHPLGLRRLQEGTGRSSTQKPLLFGEVTIRYGSNI